MNTLSERLGRHIRALRQSNNLTQENLAELADLNVTFLGHIERGTKNPTIETLNKIAIALHVSLPDLLDFNKSLPHLSPSTFSKEEELSTILKDFACQIQKLYN